MIITHYGLIPYCHNLALSTSYIPFLLFSNNNINNFAIFFNKKNDYIHIVKQIAAGQRTNASSMIKVESLLSLLAIYRSIT